MEALIRFIILAVLVFRFTAWISRLSKKKKPQKQTGGLFDEIQKQLKQLEDSFEEAPQQQETPRPVTVTARPKPVSQYPTATSMEGQSLEGQSLEITRAPYSNLEKGILDDVHQSKFEHHDITKDEIGDHKETERVNLLEDFDPKKAFIHSLIFDRKHFDV